MLATRKQNVRSEIEERLLALKQATNFGDDLSESLQNVVKISLRSRSSTARKRTVNCTSTEKLSNSASGRAVPSTALTSLSTRSMATAERNSWAPSVSTKRTKREMRRWRGT